jgi:hypothetical protein
MLLLHRCLGGGRTLSLLGAPAIDPIPNASIPEGRSLVIRVTATSPNGLSLTFSAATVADAALETPFLYPNVVTNGTANSQLFFRLMK